MSTVKLKSGIQAMISEIESESLLQSIYEFLKNHSSAKEGAIWRELSDDQKAEVLMSLEDSRDEAQLRDYTSLFAH